MIFFAGATNGRQPCFTSVQETSKEKHSSEPEALVLRTANVPVHLLTAGVPRRSSMQPQTKQSSLLTA